MPRDIHILGIFGKNNELGEGKTILSTDLALREYKEFPNKTIISDYTLPFAKPINHISEIPNFFDAHLYLDDIIPFFDARQSGHNINETWILTQLRKYQLDLTYTAQFKEGIDFRLRLISNSLIETSLICFPKFKLRFFDKQGTEIMKPKIRVYGHDVLDIYETLEIVKRRIHLNILKDLFERYNNKVAFRQITKMKFSFKNPIADSIFICLKSESESGIKDIEELLQPLGYELILT